MVANDRTAELLDDIAVKVSKMALAVLPADQEDEAHAFGRRVADMLADDWGGLSVYVPKNTAFRTRRRNAQMYEECNGTNISELARKYGLSEQRVYTVLKEERERRRPRQGVLPGLNYP